MKKDSLDSDSQNRPERTGYSLRRILNQTWSGGVVVGLLAILLVTVTIDPAGSYPGLFQGPGLTVDESFNAQQGIYLIEAVRNYGLWLLDPVIVKDVFGGGDESPYLADHPPLGRLFLGLAHHVAWSIAAPDSPVGVSVTACARFGSAVMFGLTVFLIGATAGSWFGKVSGWFASISVLLMPRVFSHAHLASLETAVSLTYCLAVLCVANSWGRCQRQSEIDSEKDEVPLQWTWKRSLFPGLMLGLAMLTKIQGFLVVPPVILWALWNGRLKSVFSLIVWGMTGAAVFFFGWSWLWLDPIGHIQQFLGSATERVSLHLYYFGTQYNDIDAPWHYPWVIFAVTVPIGLHLVGLFGVWLIICKSESLLSKRGMSLVLMCLLFPLLLFSTRAAVYDGERLFLMIYPLWGLFIGCGCQAVWKWLQQKKNVRVATATMAVFLLTQSWGIIAMHPCQLSYYNLLVGGLRGANAIGLERTYWSDSITRSFLEQCARKLPPGSVIEVAPVMHQFQVQEMEAQSPIARRERWNFRPYSGSEKQQNASTERYLILFYRQADIPTEIRDNSASFEVLVELKREGVPLAVLLRFKQ